MFDPKKLLGDLLSTNIPGTQSTIGDKAGQAQQMAKDNPLAAGALVASPIGARIEARAAIRTREATSAGAAGSGVSRGWYAAP